MFKKLKEKITEEVKSSPQRFQQLTQSVSDALGQGGSGQGGADDNLFSIGDDDANTSTPTAMSPDKGFSSVNLVSPSTEMERSRRMSTSSMSSDVSFLPRYEFNNSSYHLQSDLDASASEFEDNVSTSSTSQVGNLTKEQIHAAYQKSQLKYHKYRGRFTDLARHYKEMEREVSKMKSVLVETQDKAIRRVTELKEQCNLEQKAKAHLENALRVELDERDFKIQTLQTKIDLLQNGQTAQLIDIDKKEVEADNSEKLETLTKYLNDARTEIETLNSKIHELNEKLQENKANSIIFQTKEHEYKDKISKLEKEIANSLEREKENNLRLAENKMEIHSELLHKDAEIDKLKNEIDSLKTTLSIYEKDGNKSSTFKLENLQAQNVKLIEKIESLTQKCNGLENSLLKVEKFKIDINDLTRQNSELNQTLEEANAEKQNLLDSNSVLQTLVTNLKQGLLHCQENISKLSEEKTNLIKDIHKDRQEYENQIENFRNSAKKGLFSLEKQILSTLEKDFHSREEKLKEEFRNKLEEISSNNKSVNDIHLELVEKEGVIKKMAEEIYSLQQEIQQKNEQYTNIETNHLELIEESSKLRATIADLEKQINSLSNEDNKAYEEKIKRLQANIKTLQEDIEKYHDTIQNKEEENVKLTQDMLEIEKINKNLMEKIRILEQKEDTKEIENTECDLLELKLQKLEEEKHTLLAEFEVERQMFNKILSENKELKVKEEKIASLEETIKKLEEKVLRLKGYLKEKENTIVEVNKIKLGLEQELTKLQESFRIYREKLEAHELEKTEYNLLKIKMEQLENEKENLVKAFEVERQTFDDALHKHSVDHDEVSNKKTKIEEENVSLAKENLSLKESSKELYEKLRILEEQSQIFDLEKSEVGLLKLKLQELEEERNRMLSEFEMERELFNKVLMSHEDLKLKEQTIEDLEKSNQQLTDKIAQLKMYLNKREDNIVLLQKEKLKLENDVDKLRQNLRLLEEKSEILELDTAQSGLLKMKIQSLEEEKRSLIAEIEAERKTFEDAFDKRHHEKKRIEELSNEVLDLKQNLSAALEDLNSSSKNFKKSIADLNNQIKDKTEELTKSNEILTKTIEDLNKTKEDRSKLKLRIKEEQQKVKKLSEELQKSYETNKHIQDALNKLQTEKTDNIKKQENLEATISDLKAELSEKILQIEELNLALKETEGSKNIIKQLQDKINNLANEKHNLDNNIKNFENRIDILNTQNEELNAKIKKIEGERQGDIMILQNERDELKNTVNQLSILIEECNLKLSETENSKKLLVEEKNKLENKLKSGVETNEALNIQIKTLESCKLDLEKSLDKIKELENQKKVLENDKLDLEKRLEELTQNLAETNVTVNKLKELETEKQSLENNKELIESDKIALEKRLQEMEHSLEENVENVKKLRELENVKASLESDKLDLENKIKEMEQNLQTNGVNIKKLEDLENEKAELEKNLKKKTIELKSKIKDTQNLEDKYGQINEEKHNMEEEIKNLMTRIEELTQENHSLHSITPKAKESEHLKKQNEALQKKYDKLQQELSEFQLRISQLSSDNSHLNEEQERLLSELSEHKTKSEFLEVEKTEFDTLKLQLEQENQSLKTLNLELNEKLDISSKKIQDLSQKSEEVSSKVTNDLDLVQIQKDFYEIKEKCDSFFIENKNLKAEYTKLEEQCYNFGKIKQDLESQITDLENHYSEAQHEKQLLQDEINELKISPLNLKNSNSLDTNPKSGNNLEDLAIVRHETALAAINGAVGGAGVHLDELENLKDKLHHYKSLDITNKSSIEFYENELHRMKVKNEKLCRQLDETLVTLSHVNELSHSTEIEYLRNVLYNYMLGKESMVLAKVIAAVCKFDDSQTEAVLQKEQQRQTLLGQLGLL